MPRKQSVRVVVIVEDRSLDQFVWHTLKAFGFTAGKVAIRDDYPKQGHGSGKQYVEDRYRKEIVTFRQRNRENIALILGTEADEQTTDARAQALDAQVAAIGKPPRGISERIVYWIPKRHVETWGLHLTGGSVDEDTDYHNKGRCIDWREAGQSFWTDFIEFKKGTASPLPSLDRAYDETGRLGL